MNASEFDAIKYRKGILAGWQKTAEAWHEWWMSIDCFDLDELGFEVEFDENEQVLLK